MDSASLAERVIVARSSIDSVLRIEFLWVHAQNPNHLSRENLKTKPQSRENLKTTTCCHHDIIKCMITGILVRPTQRTPSE